ncbi:transposase [Rhodococcus erythropolis]
MTRDRRDHKLPGEALEVGLSAADLILAARILGRSGRASRFPTAAAYANCTGTAPVQIASAKSGKSSLLRRFVGGSLPYGPHRQALAGTSPQHLTSSRAARGNGPAACSYTKRR